MTCKLEELKKETVSLKTILQIPKLYKLLGCGMHKENHAHVCKAFLYNDNDISNFSKQLSTLTSQHFCLDTQFYNKDFLKTRCLPRKVFLPDI